MTIDEIVGTLIQAVSDNGHDQFLYEEGDQKLVLKRKRKKRSAGPQLPVVISQPATRDDGAMPMQMAAAPAKYDEAPEKAAEEKKREPLDIGSGQGCDFSAGRTFILPLLRRQRHL